MSRLSGIAMAALGAGVLVGGTLAGVVVAQVAGAASAPVVIGVDNTPPGGHDFEYVDYFPRSSVQVHTGDVVDFHWNASPDGFHTVDLLKTGETLAQHFAAQPQTVPDSDEGPGHFQLNPAIGPTFPPAGSGAPGACGSATTPCTYSGSSELHSGPNPTTGALSFFATINAPAGTTLNFLCDIHPGMHGSLQVVANSVPATTPAQAASAALAQAAADTSQALSAEAAVGAAATHVDANGHRTVSVVAGTATAYVEVVEFLPHDITVGAGDTVTWTTHTIKEIHTVTFPAGTHLADPIPSVCEASPTDTPFTGGNGPPCGNPANFEHLLVPASVGSTTISNTSQVASSGILANPPAPFPSSYSFTFSTPGTFNFFCHIHENGMRGTVVVQAASVVPIPVNGKPKFTG